MGRVVYDQMVMHVKFFHWEINDSWVVNKGIIMERDDPLEVELTFWYKDGRCI